MKFIGIIPARYGSTRFPGKPLAEICNRTVIHRVYEQASKALETVVVATDDERIYDAVEAFGGKVVMTRADHKCGTDRCLEAYEAITTPSWREQNDKETVIINIQGDEPFIQPEQIETLMRCFDQEGTQIATLVRPYTDKDSKEVTVGFEGPVEGSEYMRQHNLRASACGYIFRKATLVNLRFRSGTLHEDEEFTPQLILRAERLFYTDAEAYFYRKRSKSITNNDDLKWRLRRLNDMEQIILNLNERADSLPQADREGLQRRVAQLTMDYIYNNIRLIHDSKHLENCIEQLHEKGLFPLPDRNYTRKYIWFRRLSMSKIGRKILLMTIQKQ